MANLTTLKDKQGNTLYPLTKTNAVSDSNGTSLDSILSGKQNSLLFDNTPTQNSTNPVTSGGIYDAIKYSFIQLKTTNELSLSSNTDVNVGGVAGLVLDGSRGNQLSFDTNTRAITIGVGVDFIKVTIRGRFYMSTSAELTVSVWKNGSKFSSSQENFNQTSATHRVDIVNLIIPVSENDVITYSVKSSSSNNKLSTDSKVLIEVI